MPKATLINSAGQKVVVEAGSPQAQQYFSQGYKLMTAKPAAPAPVATKPAPVTPAPAQATPDPLAGLAKSFGSNGGSFADYSKAAEAQNQITPEEKAKIYGDLGIPDLESKSFALPSQSTEALYTTKYNELGLQGIKDRIAALNDQINSKKDELNKAVGAVSENPWLSEASRVGRSRRLQELAGGDIDNLIGQHANLTDLYNAGIGEINNYVSRQSTDFQNEVTVNKAKLDYLLKKAEGQLGDLQSQKNAKVYRYAPDYLQATTDRDLLTKGYTPITDPSGLKGLKESDITRIGSRIYKNPAPAADYQFINSNDVAGVFDKTSGKFVPYSAGAGTGGGVNVGGYDISSYATDPNHEASVQSILNKIGQLRTVQDIDSYIKKVAPGSPITGQMVANASGKYGVSWEMLVAMMQQDSSLGTKGKGARTFNPGNWGNDDSGNTVTFKNWQEGVNAVGQWLAKHKASGAVAANPASEAWAKQIAEGKAKISDVPKELKNQVVTMLDTVTGGQASAAEQNKSEAVRLVDEMIADPARAAATGASAFRSKIPASAARAFAAKVERLSGLLTLDAIKQMKGLGALSDAEGRRLEFSMSILKDRYISEADYLAELKRVKDTLTGSGLMAQAAGDQPTNSTNDPLGLR